MALYAPIIIKNGRLQQLQVTDGIGINRLVVGGVPQTDPGAGNLHVNGEIRIMQGAARLNLQRVGANYIDFNDSYVLNFRSISPTDTNANIRMMLGAGLNIGGTTFDPGSGRLILQASLSGGPIQQLTLYNTDTSGEGGRIEWYSGYGGGKATARMWSNANGPTGGDFHVSVLIAGTLTEAFFINPVGSVVIGQGSLNVTGDIYGQNLHGGILYLTGANNTINMSGVSGNAVLIGGTAGTFFNNSANNQTQFCLYNSGGVVVGRYAVMGDPGQGRLAVENSLNIGANNPSTSTIAFFCHVGSNRNFKITGGFLTSAALRITAVTNDDSTLIPLELFGGPVIIGGGLNVNGTADPGAGNIRLQGWLYMSASDSGVDLSNGSSVKRMAADGRLQLNSQSGQTECTGDFYASNVPSGGTWNSDGTWDNNRCGSVGWYNIGGMPSGFGTGYRSKMADPSYGNEIYIPYDTDAMWMRRRHAAVYQAWHQIPVMTASGVLAIGSGHAGGVWGDIATGRSGVYGTASGIIYLGDRGDRYVFFDGANYIMPGGNVVANGVTLTSSRSLKKGIRDFPRKRRRLRVRMFERQGKAELGFIAEEVKPIFPESIRVLAKGANGEDLGKLGLDVMSLIAKHELDIQELQDKLGIGT